MKWGWAVWCCLCSVNTPWLYYGGMGPTCGVPNCAEMLCKAALRLAPLTRGQGLGRNSWTVIFFKLFLILNGKNVIPFLAYVHILFYVQLSIFSYLNNHIVACLWICFLFPPEFFGWHIVSLLTDSSTSSVEMESTSWGQWEEPLWCPGPGGWWAGPLTGFWQLQVSGKIVEHVGYSHLYNMGEPLCMWPQTEHHF